MKPGSGKISIQKDLEKFKGQKMFQGFFEDGKFSSEKRIGPRGRAMDSAFRCPGFESSNLFNQDI